MDFWLSKEECCGCTACKNACPVKAIEFKKSEEDFKYPDINTEKCVNCGKCKSVCPVYNKKNLGHLRADIFNRGITRVFSAENKDDEIRYMSASGGVFSAVAAYFLNNNGVVFGAAYEETTVKHTYITQISELDKLRGTKYVQSEIGDSYSVVRDYLQNGIQVLWVGTPCQVAGLYEFLGKDHENLTTIEIICMGVNSPGIFQKWLKEIEQENKKKIQKVQMRYKDNGWRDSASSIRIDFTDGTYIVRRGKNNYYMKGFLDGRLYLRESCYNCSFKGYSRSADLIMGDFWGIEGDDNNGTSVIMVNSLKGSSVLAKVEDNFNLKEQKLEDIVKNNPGFSISEPRNEKRDAFFQYIQQESLEKVIKRVLPKKNFFYKVKRKIKKVYKHIEGK